MPASESRFSNLSFKSEQVFERVIATGLGAVQLQGPTYPTQALYLVAALPVSHRSG